MSQIWHKKDKKYFYKKEALITKGRLVIWTPLYLRIFGLQKTLLGERLKRQATEVGKVCVIHIFNETLVPTIYKKFL